MNHSGDAAEQIVRMSLEGVEVAAKITGAAAKELAVFLLAALKSPGKTGKGLKLKGKARLTSMLKSGKSLEIFSVKESDLKDFMRGARQYGVLYCVLRSKGNNPDGLCDIMVRADDAPKISRIIERYKFATVERARVENETVPERGEQYIPDAQESPESDAPDTDAPDTDAPDINDVEALLDEFLGAEDAAPEQAAPVAENPDFFLEMTERSNPSEPSSGSKSSIEKDTSSRPSVKEQLREIHAVRKQEEEKARPMQGERDSQAKPKANTSTVHQQPQGRSKSIKIKDKGR